MSKSEVSLRLDAWEANKLSIGGARLEFENVLKPAVFLVPQKVRVISRFSRFQPEGIYIEWSCFRSNSSTEAVPFSGYTAKQHSGAKCLTAFLSLCDVEDKEAERFVDFARRYGVLGILPYVYDEKTQDGTIRHTWESLDLWRQFARRCRAILDVSAELVNDRLVSRESWKELIYRDDLWWIGIDRDRFFVELPLQRVVLARLLNEMLRHIASRPQIVWQEQVPTVLLEMEYLTDRWDYAYLHRRWFEKENSPKYLEYLREEIREAEVKNEPRSELSPFEKEWADICYEFKSDGQDSRLTSSPNSGEAPMDAASEPWMLAVDGENDFVGGQAVFTDFRAPVMFETANLRPSTLYNVLLTQIMATLAAPEGLTRCHVCDAAFIPKRKTARGRAALCGNAACKKKRHAELSCLRMRDLAEGSRPSVSVQLNPTSAKSRLQQVK